MNEHKVESVETRKIERLLENLSHLGDRTSGLRNRVHSAEERINGVRDGKGEDMKDDPAAFGSMDQSLAGVAKIHDIVDDCHNIMNKIESAI